MFHDGVITMDGLELDTKIRAGLATAVFTSIKFGDGLYDGTEDLSQCSGMKSVRQSFGISSICVIDKKQVRLRTVTDNTGIEEGYYISELGVYAEDPDKGEILYSLSLGVPQKMDYQPSETELAGATGTFDVYTDVSNVEEATVAVGTGAAASAEDLAETNTRVDGLMNPEFEDYSGEGAEVPDAREAIANIRSKKGFTGIMSNIKAALMGLATLGEIRGLLVNNGLCSEAGKFFLDAAYGKNLQDQLTKLNSDNLPFVNDVSDFNITPDMNCSFYTTPGCINFPSLFRQNTCLGIQYYAGSQWKCQIAICFSRDAIAIRRKESSETWTEWRYIEAS